jgi:hypothetical protein
MLRHGTSGFTSHPKEDVLRNFIAFKNSSPRADLNPRPLGPVGSTLSTTSPKRLYGRLLVTDTKGAFPLCQDTVHGP